MHNYSTDKNNSQYIIGILLIISFILDFTINSIINNGLSNLISDPFFVFFIIHIFTFIVSFGILFWLFDTKLWKLKIINNFVGCPDVSGKWKGYIYSTNYQPTETNVEIRQTWTKISINLKTKTASSKSETLAFFTQDSGNPELHYIYYNKVRDTTYLKSHGGTGFLTFFKEKKMLKGEYYTDEHRKNNGKLILNKVN